MDMMKKEEIVEHENEIDIHGQEDEQIYPMDGIKVDKGFYSVFELKRRYDALESRVILDSDFQREDVWNINRKAELVESVLMGLPLPVFYFNQDKYGRLIVVDGRQRLTALFEYMTDEFSLINLKILSELNNLRFSKLQPVLQSRIEDYQIQAHVILPPTPDRIKFDIFDRVNRGGVQLNKQEIRNALYQGEATRLLNKIVKSEAFRNATGNAFLNEKRMKDKYLVTRFLTFCLAEQNRILDDEGRQYQYEGDIDDFLGRGMDAINSMGITEILDLEELTDKTLKKVFFYMGENAFRLMRNGKRGPINMNVFETVMCIVKEIPDICDERKVRTKETILTLLESEMFLDNIGSRRDNAVRLNWRLNTAKEIGRSLAV